MRMIEVHGERLACHLLADDFRPGLSFFSRETDFVQVGSWGYDAGKDLHRHIHNDVAREVGRTQEVLVVLAGAIQAELYDAEERPVETLAVRSGEVLILLAGGHGYRVLEDGTKVIEIKNGPYPGAEVDRRRF